MKFLFLSFALMFSEVAIHAAEEARPMAARADIAGCLKSALDNFKIDCGRYPTTSEGFKAMLNCPTNISGGRWRGPYFDPAEIPRDPWGNVYVYLCPGIHNTNGFDLYSCGFDGISKSGGNDLDDINNWDPSSPHGGNDGYLNYFQLVTRSPEFILSIFALWIIIAVSGLVRLIAAIFSQSIRASIARHPIAHIIWLLVSLSPFILFLLGISRLAG
jgi:general secretion pathway protein G